MEGQRGGIKGVEWRNRKIKKENERKEKKIIVRRTNYKDKQERRVTIYRVERERGIKRIKEKRGEQNK